MGPVDGIIVLADGRANPGLAGGMLVRTDESAAGAGRALSTIGEDKARKVIGKSARHIVTHYMLQQHYDNLADCAH